MIKKTPILCLFAIFFIVAPTFAQEKKTLQHEDINEWTQSITFSSRLSADGNWASWVEAPARGDGVLQITSTDGKTRYSIPRASGALFSGDSHFVLFKIVAEADSVRQKKLDDVAKKDMPTDSLGIMNLSSGSVQKFADVTSFKVSLEGGALAAFKLTEEASKEDAPADSTTAETEVEPEEEEEEEEEKDKPDKKKGTSLVVIELNAGTSTTYQHVSSYEIAEEGNGGAFFRETEEGSTDGAYAFSADGTEESDLLIAEGNYVQLTVSQDGEQIAFLSNQHDFEAEQPAFEAYYANGGQASRILTTSSEGIPKGWWISEYGSLSFSDSGDRLFFGTAPRPEPEVEDEDILDEEKVRLDIWNWKDPLLQPMQLVQASREQNRSYQALWDVSEKAVVQLADIDIPTVRSYQDGDGAFFMGVTNMNYRQEISWDSPGYNDVWIIDATTGDRRQVLTAIQYSPSISPEGTYLTYWDRDRAVWVGVETDSGRVFDLTANFPVSLVNDLDDRAYAPSAYGNEGWTEGEVEFVVNDKYDLWGVSPDGVYRNITGGHGRENQIRFGHREIDRERNSMALDKWLLTALNLNTMESGYWEQDLDEDVPKKVFMSPHRYRIWRTSEDLDTHLFSKESYQEFPNLHVTNGDFEKPVQLSQVNPQQSEFNWGTAELHEWTSLDGESLKGILYKPEGFDASNEYPMMVYFYEKYSENLHSHRTPSAGGSSINFPFYVSRGYLLFVPDIPYKTGYPGESAMNAIMPGITSLIDQGFVDRDRIGTQGHSWGGYQIAYMVTQTDLFAAAEAGAPVSNMTSAYGGIRWASGMSRMFQYERTQSRIGGTLWDAQQRYIHNSPLFQADKVKTPLLMMHNDDDGAVPWYQGIEYFVALRRLGQPVWMLNYNGAGHGLSDLDDRRDWQIRMQQFFDHYLMDAPAPVWMERGVPAVDKGKSMGLELVGK